VTVTRTVVPGDWYGVLGDNVIVLLPPAAKARVAGLWETVDEGAGFDEVLDALISGGLRELPGFVLVSGDGLEVKIVIRGAGEAELTTKDGPITVSGSADTTWVEQNVSGVTGLRVRVADAEGAPYTVGPGLVRVASVEHPASTGAVTTPDAEAVAVPVEPPKPPRPARILPPDPQLQPPPTEEPTAEPTPEPEAPMPPPVAPIPGAPVPVPGPLGGSTFDPLTSPDLAVTPVHERTSDDTGDHQDGGITPASTAIARLIFSSGEVVDVDRAVVVGRAPDAGRYGGDEQTRVVTVPSPHQEISSTHLEIRPGTGADLGSAVVTDLGSTNGTVVVQPGLPAEDLRPGIAVQLIPGATIDLGEGVTIQVTGV
jgi:FHA domain